MRHLRNFKKLGRTSEHRLAMHRNLAQNLIEHGEIRTTVPKARDLRPFVEKLVTLAIKARTRKAAGDAEGSLRARRLILSALNDRSIVDKAHRADYWAMSDADRKRALVMPSGRRHRTGEAKGQLAFTGESVVHRLIEKVAARLEDRNGGYTRIVKLPQVRVGDNAPLASIRFVGDEEAPTSLTKPRKTQRRVKADARYRLTVKLLKAHGRTQGGASEKKGESA